MKHTKIVFGILSFILLNLHVKAQVVGSGGDGPLTVSSTVAIDGTRAAVNSITGSGGSKTLSLDAGHNYGTWAYGQKVLIILMSKSGGTNPTRNWQMATVLTSGTNSLQVTDFATTNWCTTSSSTCKIQVIKVPQYTNVYINSGGILTCSTWDGYTGGVLVFVANNALTITSGGWLNVAVRGFSNSNTGGSNGAGATANAAPAAQGGANGANGNDGILLSLPIRKEGQAECYRGTSTIPGGFGGAGGFYKPGTAGTAGSAPQTRLSLPKSTAPKLLMLGNGGKQGDGGKGGDAGGSGGNGGNGYATGGGIGGPGIAGNAGASGGKGGSGGTGGGIIICFANSVFTPSGTQCIDISGSAGTPGGNGGWTAIAGLPGDGGDGGQGQCVGGGIYYGFGGGGIKGLRGQGASGGSGGSGGSSGSFSIRTTYSADNHLDKATNVKYTPGAAGAKGYGAPAPPAATDGNDGCTNDDMTSCPSPTPLCIKRKYDVYKCAGFRAFQVLGDMNQATDYGGYYKFTSTKSGAVSKKSGANISVDPKYYFCVYFKCSRLLVAYEDDQHENDAALISKPDCNNATPVGVAKELRGNCYWVKLKDAKCPTCDDLMKSYFDEVVANPTTVDYNPVPGTNPDYGYVDFGVSHANFQFYDSDPSKEAGYWRSAKGGEYCYKDCEKGEFDPKWMDINYNYPCACAPGGGSQVPGGPGGPNYESFPDLPYIAELWDIVKPGDDGQDGDPGDGDDTYFDDGAFDAGEEDGMGEMPPYNGLTSLTAIGKYFAVSPNPTSGNDLTLVTKGSGNTAIVALKIFDLAGKLVWERQEVKIVNGMLSCDIAKLEAGSYFVQISSQKINETLKFVKH